MCVMCVCVCVDKGTSECVGVYMCVSGFNLCLPLLAG